MTNKFIKDDGNDNKNMYFAARKAEKAAGIILDKADSWFQQLEANQYMDKVRKCWSAYHGAYYSDTSSGHEITFSGEQGELTNLPVNHFRNLARHMLVMVTASRPAFQARSTNTDYKSLVQTKLANGLLDYYMREKRLEDHLQRAVEYAIVMSAGYIKMGWNATRGKAYDFNEETQTHIYEGDVEFTTISPFDVVFDSTKEDQNHDWIMCRSYLNKYDLAAKYPEYEEKLINLSTKSDNNHYRFDLQQYENTDDVSVYEFYHKRTESMPEGRYMLFINEEIIMMDVPMPYRELPIYRLSPADILGTPYGYSPMFDLLPIQDAINSLYSTILTNQTSFGIQNVYVPRGADISVNQLVGSLNIIEGNPQMGKPEPLNLTSTPKEIFNFMNILERLMETISGINSVARGNPESSLKSGNALALVQSQALQFMSGLQRSYVKMIEDVGTGLINMLKDFAAVPRVAAIAGKRNRTIMKEFKGDDLSTINRVIVDAGNALAKTTAGKLQIAEQLLQMKLIKSPEQYFSVLNTGELDMMTDGEQNELLLIQSENERLIEDNEDPIAVATDNHPLHIREHKTVLADPDFRKDPELVRRTLTHIQSHIDLMRNTDPDLLTMVGVQPLGPVGGSPANQPQMVPPKSSLSNEQVMSAEEAAGVAVSPENMGIDIPSPASPPAPFQNAPTSPEDL